MFYLVMKVSCLFLFCVCFIDWILVVLWWFKEKWICFKMVWFELIYWNIYYDRGVFDNIIMLFYFEINKKIWYLWS